MSPAAPRAISPAAYAVGLTKTYGTGEATVHALAGVNVTFERGRFTAVMGPSGSGKSTLMKSLIGVMPARSGRILIDGADLSGLPSYERVARGLAYVPQGRQIFGTMTVTENGRDFRVISDLA